MISTSLNSCPRSARTERGLLLPMSCLRRADPSCRESRGMLTSFAHSIYPDSSRTHPDRTRIELASTEIESGCRGVGKNAVTPRQTLKVSEPVLLFAANIIADMLCQVSVGELRIEFRPSDLSAGSKPGGFDVAERIENGRTRTLSHRPDRKNKGKSGMDLPKPSEIVVVPR